MPLDSCVLETSRKYTLQSTCVSGLWRMLSFVFVARATECDISLLWQCTVASACIYASDTMGCTLPRTTCCAGVHTFLVVLCPTGGHQGTLSMVRCTPLHGLPADVPNVARLRRAFHRLLLVILRVLKRLPHHDSIQVRHTVRRHLLCVLTSSATCVDTGSARLLAVWVG